MAKAIFVTPLTKTVEIMLVQKAVLIALIVAAPVASFAQSSRSVTRAQVRDEIAQLQNAGYNPRDWVNYPENFQTAQAKVADRNGAGKRAVSGYGGGVDGTTGSGSATGQ